MVDIATHVPPGPDLTVIADCPAGCLDYQILWTAGFVRPAVLDACATLTGPLPWLKWQPCLSPLAS